MFQHHVLFVNVQCTECITHTESALILLHYTEINIPVETAYRNIKTQVTSMNVSRVSIYSVANSGAQENRVISVIL